MFTCGFPRSERGRRPEPGRGRRLREIPQRTGPARGAARTEQAGEKPGLAQRGRSRPAPPGPPGALGHARRAKRASREARGGASLLSPQAESLTRRHVVFVLLRSGEVFRVEFLHVAAARGGRSHRTSAAAPNGKALGRDHRAAAGAVAAGAGPPPPPRKMCACAERATSSKRDSSGPMSRA